MGICFRHRHALFAASLVLSGCGGSNDPGVDVPLNTPPTIVADAPTQIIDDQQTSVNLVVTASDDQGIAGYSWTQIWGVPVSIENATTASAHFDTPIVTYALGAQQLVFEVVVTDSNNAIATIQLQVTIEPNNITPTAIIEAPTNAFAGEVVVLTVNAADSDGEITGYQWQQISGPEIALIDADKAVASFEAPDFRLDTDLEFKVTAVDDKQTAVEQSTAVTVNGSNTAPQLTLIPEQSADEQTEVTLTVQAVDDHGINAYQWQQTSGATLALTGADSAVVTFNAPIVTVGEGEQIFTFEVVVNDNDNASSTAQTTVKINPVNAAPTVTATAQRTGDNNNTVVLSTDAADSDGSISSYQWTQLSGTTVTLNNATEATASFTAPQLEQDETLNFEITVTDNEHASTDAQVSVSIIGVGPPPTITTQSTVTVKSGAFTVLQWAVDSKNPNYTVTLEQTGSESDLTIVVTDQNQAYFTAPESSTDALTRTLKLTVTDDQGLSGEAPIEINVQTSAASLFPDNKSIYNINSNGFDFRSVDIADLDGDGISDIIARERDGTYWFKNNGNLDIDMIPKQKLRGAVSFFKDDFDLIEDINGDGSIDLVFVQLNSDSNGLYYLPNDGNGKFGKARLIGNYPASSPSGERYFKVFTFTADGVAGKYIAVTTDSSSSGEVSIFEPNQSGHTLISTQEYTEQSPMARSIVACDIRQSGKPDLFLQTMKNRAGPGTRESTLHVISSTGNYQVDTVIKEVALGYTALACMPTKDTNRLLQYEQSGSSESVHEVVYNSTESTYAIDKSSVTLPTDDLSIVYEFQVIDLDANGIDDLVGLDDRGEVQASFLRSNATDLSFTNSDRYLGRFKIDRWAETGDYRLYRIDDNKFWLSDKFGDKNHWQDTEGTSVEFEPQKSIRGLTNVNGRLIVSTQDSNYNKYVSTVKYVDGQLEQDSGFDASPMNNYGYIFSDYNNDGISDIIYTSVKEDKHGAPNLHVIVRIGNDKGFGEEQVLHISDYVDREVSFLMNELRDLNGDGIKDIGIFAFDDNFWEFWLIYDSESKTYQNSRVNYDGLFNTDYDSSSGLTSSRSFKDITGNGLSDIYRLGELSTQNAGEWELLLGIPQVNLQQSPGKFGHWIDLEQRKVHITRRQIVDFDLDGINDLGLEGYELTDDGHNDVPFYRWYQIEQDGNISKRQMPQLPSTYENLFDHNQAYFFDLNQSKQTIAPYYYSELANRPVVSEIQTLPIPTTGNYKFLDIDQDGDKDIVHFDDSNIYLIENKHK